MGDRLSVAHLLNSGFVEVGCWEVNDARDLVHQINLPTSGGVYAFAMDGDVQYVGLASKSLRQRLGFYRKPGASQTTNVRLNEIIRGHIVKGAIVQILIGQPLDYEWNGLKVSGAQGLEAGLIATFELAWNVRGSTSAIRPSPTRRLTDRNAEGSLAAQILQSVCRRPGMTELEIAKTIYGPGAVQPQVNQNCRLLVARGLVERQGKGGRADPFTYHPSKK